MALLTKCELCGRNLPRDMAIEVGGTICCPSCALELQEQVAAREAAASRCARAEQPLEQQQTERSASSSEEVKLPDSAKAYVGVFIVILVAIGFLALFGWLFMPILLWLAATLYGVSVLIAVYQDSIRLSAHKYGLWTTPRLFREHPDFFLCLSVIVGASVVAAAVLAYCAGMPWWAIGLFIVVRWPLIFLFNAIQRV